MVQDMQDMPRLRLEGRGPAKEGRGPENRQWENGAENYLLGWQVRNVYTSTAFQYLMAALIVAVAASPSSPLLTFLKACSTLPTLKGGLLVAVVVKHAYDVLLYHHTGKTERHPRLRHIMRAPPCNARRSGSNWKSNRLPALCLDH